MDEFKSFNVASDFIYYLQQFVPKGRQGLRI